MPFAPVVPTARQARAPAFLDSLHRCMRASASPARRSRGTHRPGGRATSGRSRGRTAPATASRQDASPTSTAAARNSTGSGAVAASIVSRRSYTASGCRGCERRVRRRAPRSIARGVAPASGLALATRSMTRRSDRKRDGASAPGHASREPAGSAGRSVGRRTRRCGRSAPACRRGRAAAPARTAAFGPRAATSNSGAIVDGSRSQRLAGGDAGSLSTERVSSAAAGQSIDAGRASGPLDERASTPTAATATARPAPSASELAIGRARVADCFERAERRAPAHGSAGRIAERRSAAA